VRLYKVNINAKPQTPKGAFEDYDILSIFFLSIALNKGIEI
jgi:hypothetical protein